VDVAFQHDLGAGRHLQRHAQRGRHLGARAAQQAGELVFGQASGTGVTAPRMVAGSAQRHGHREGLAGVGAVLAEVQRAAAVGQPAHDDLVRPSTCWR
jgi:hypothetical protein